MEEILLRDPDIHPSQKVLEDALGKNNKVYNEFIGIITSPTLGLVPEWRYYKDGKSWLCKVCHKKKTIFWLSVWDKYFKLGFYFSEKNCSGIAVLNIDKKIKDEFKKSKNIGKLIPLVIKMNSKDQIDDVLKIIEYKKALN